MNASTTVIILNWNCYQLTFDCIRSLMAMEDADCDIVVVDNGSTDGSVGLLERGFPGITVLAQNSNLGFAAGCNVGMRYALASGAEYILLLNNDTHVAADFLREMRATIESDPEIALVCPKIYFADQPKMLWYAGGDFSLWTGAPKHRGWKEIDRGQFDQHLEISQGTGCAMLVRGSVVRDMGLLDEQFWAYVEDLDWSVRFLKGGYRLVFSPKARVWHREGSTSVKLMGSGSQALRQFLSTRNMVLLARKHLRWWQLPTYIIGFLFTHIFFYTALRIWRHDLRALRAIYAGLRQGLNTSLNSEWPISGQLSQQEEAANANRN